MNTSPAGIALISGFESLMLRAYPDPGSRDGTPWTIGWGTTRYPDGRAVQPGDTCTREEADAWLAHDLAAAEAEVNRVVRVPLSPGQFDALVSFQYNTGALGRSTLLRLLNAGDYAGAAAQFARWNKNDGKVLAGLTRRRAAEAALFTQTTARSLLAAPQEAPVSPFIIPALDILARAVPTIADLFKGEAPSRVAERNIDAVKRIAETVLPAVVEAAGAENEQAAAQAVEADPAVALKVEEEMRRRFHDLSRVALREDREFAMQYAQMKDVRTIVWNLTFLELFTLLLVVLSACLIGLLLWLGMLTGELLGAVVTMVVVASVVDTRKFWLGLPAADPPKDRE